MAKKKQQLPPNAVTDRHLAEFLRLKADVEAARRGDPDALPGLVRKQRSAGKPGLTARERERVADLYENMTTAPGPCRPQYARTPTRLDLLYENAASWIDYQRTGEKRPPEIPSEAVFVPDCDVPMSLEDALRNVGRYLGHRSRRRTHDLLSDLSRTVRPLRLPPRRGANIPGV